MDGKSISADLIRTVQVRAEIILVDRAVVLLAHQREHFVHADAHHMRGKQRENNKQPDGKSAGRNKQRNMHTVGFALLEEFKPQDRDNDRDIDKGERGVDQQPDKTGDRGKTEPEQTLFFQHNQIQLHQQRHKNIQ